MKSDKQALLDWITNLPDDIQTFMYPANQYDCVDLKIFLVHKDEEFLKWYFAP